MADSLTIKNQNRFDFLDGIRGAAALAVMVYHYSYFDFTPLVSNAFAAVDIFFIMSGFVIAHSYGEKIKQGMSFSSFIFLRLIRLYPLYFIGLTCGFLVLLSQAHRYTDLADFFSQASHSYALNIFMLPYFGDLLVYERDISKSVAYPSDPALWSLFFEIFVSLAFFVFVKFGKKTSSIGVAIAGIVLFFAAGLYFGQPNPGWGGVNFVGGFPRVVGEFALGTVLYVNRERIKPTNPWVLTLLAGAVAASFIVRFKGSWMLYSLVLYPGFILLGARKPLEGIARSIASYMGKLSYPLYIIHMPIYMVAYEWTGIQALPEFTRLILLVTVSLLVSVVLCEGDNRFRQAVEDLLKNSSLLPGRNSHDNRQA